MKFPGNKKAANDMFDRLRQGFRHAFRREAATQAGPDTPQTPQSLASSEARLCIRQVNGVVEFQPTFCDAAMLRLRGHLCGSLSTMRIDGRSAGSLLRLRLPMRVEAREIEVEITVMRPASNDASSDYVLVRARRRRVPPDRQAIELLFTNAREEQIRYLVQTQASVQPLDFQDVSRHDSVFREVPSVSQMIAFLRATLHHRRTTLRSLVSMTRNAEAPHVRALVDEMNRRLSHGQDFATDALRRLTEYLDDQGHTTNANTVAALTILSDIYMRNLESVHLDALVDQGEPLPISNAAMAATALFLGIDQRNLPDFLERTDDTDRAFAFLRSTVAGRNTLSILTDLADDSGSERSRTRVDQLLARVTQNQNLLNDEHIALQKYMEARGRRIQSETISALAIYVDFEAGILNEEDIDGLTPQRAFHDASLYSMLAIARAFDFELHCWLLPVRRSLEGSDPDMLWLGLENVLSLSSGGVIARFLDEGQPGHQTMYIATASDIGDFRQRGYAFTGEVLAEIPSVSHLQGSELADFEAVRKPIIARFVSEAGVVAWRLLDELKQSRQTGSAGQISRAVRPLPDRPYSFIDRYDVFHFGGSVLGSYVPVQARSLVGKRKRLLVYQDARGAAHYMFFAHINSVEDVMTVPQHDWTWGGAKISFPDAAIFPRCLTEASHEYLLGLPDDRASLERLGLVYSGLEDCLFLPYEMELLKEVPGVFEQLWQSLHSNSLRALLVGVLDVRARHEAVALIYTKKDSLWISRTLREGFGVSEFVELASLVVLGTLLACKSIPHERRLLVEILLDRLLAAAESEDVDIKRRAVELIGSDVVASDDEERLAFSYVLCRFMDHDVPHVARAAARSLGVLAMRAVHGPPMLAAIGPPTPRTLPGPVDLDALADEVMSVFSVPPEQQKYVMTIMSALEPVTK